MSYDALLVVSFGGPEGPDDVLPFMENVTRGRRISRERLREVSAHYQSFGGVSPINAQNRALIAALDAELQRSGTSMPVYWGNRNWHPMLADTMAQMTVDGVEHALGFVTSAYSSYSACRQYLDNIESARKGIGANAPRVDRLRVFFNHPGFIAPMIDHTRSGLAERLDAALLFTAHSIPMAMANTSRYESQLREVAGLIATACGRDDWQLVFQSRSGPPDQPWLEPDINDALRRVTGTGQTDVVVVPIGFTSDHIEVLYDLDIQAAATADEAQLTMVRVPTVGTDPRFIGMIRELMEERTLGATARWLGSMAPDPSMCGPTCCPARVQRDGDFDGDSGGDATPP